MILGIPARRLAGQVITATWSPLSKYQSESSVLSSGNTTLTANTAATGNYANAVSSREVLHLGYYSGYVETNSGDNAGIGTMQVSRTNPAAEAPGNSSFFVGNTGASLGLWVNSGAVYRFGASTISGTSTLTAAVEIAVRRVLLSGTTFQYRVWLRRSGGSWIGGGDPAADTSPTHAVSVATSTNYYCIGASLTRAGANSSRFALIHGDAASTTGTPPAGFAKALWGPELT